MRIVYYNENPTWPEVDVSGKPTEMVKLGKKLSNTFNNIELKLENYQDKIFKNTLLIASFNEVSDPDKMLSVKIKGDTIEFTGGREYFDRLGGSFISFYGDVIDEEAHFVMDKHDECIIAEDTDMSIFCNIIPE